MARQAQSAERVETARRAATPLSPSGALSTSFEVQIFRDKRWRIDSMFDDKSLALYEARRMNDSGRYVCVRVVEEYFDEVTGNTKLWTIYRGGRIEQAHQTDVDEAIKRRGSTQQRSAAAVAAAAAATAKDRHIAESRPKLVLAMAGGAVLLLLLAAVAGFLLLK
jgi:hypothetical protein